MRPKRLLNFSVFILTVLSISLYFFALPGFAGAPPTLSFEERNLITDYNLKPRVLVQKPTVTYVSPTASISHVVVKFKDGPQVRLRGGSLISKKGISVKKAKRTLGADLNSSFRRVCRNTLEEKLDRDRRTLQLKPKRELPA